MPRPGRVQEPGATALNPWETHALGPGPTPAIKLSFPPNPMHTGRSPQEREGEEGPCSLEGPHRGLSREAGSS